VSDQPEALRLADWLEYQVPMTPPLRAKASDELRRQHGEIVELKAERDALLAEVERLKGVGYDLIGQLMVLNATKQMQAAIDAVRGDK
jgi:transcriptional antiterminator Rof (Rho-off)